MNVGGLALLLLLSAVALLGRRSLRGAAGPMAAFQRRALLVLALAFPAIGLLLPFVPWRAAAAALALLLAVAVGLIVRRLDRLESAAKPGDRG